MVMATLFPLWRGKRHYAHQRTQRKFIRMLTSVLLVHSELSFYTLINRFRLPNLVVTQYAMDQGFLPTMLMFCLRAFSASPLPTPLATPSHMEAVFCQIRNEIRLELAPSN